MEKGIYSLRYNVFYSDGKHMQPIPSETSDYHELFLITMNWVILVRI